MKCDICGVEIPEGHRLCPQCFEENKKELRIRANSIMGRQPVRKHPAAIVLGVLFINVAVQMISRHLKFHEVTGASLFVATNLLIWINWRLRLYETEILPPGIYPDKEGNRLILGGSLRLSLNIRGWPLTFFECGSEEPTYHKRWILTGFCVDAVCFICILSCVAILCEKFS